MTSPFRRAALLPSACIKSLKAEINVRAVCHVCCSRGDCRAKPASVGVCARAELQADPEGSCLAAAGQSGAGRARLRGATPKRLVRTGSGYLWVYTLPCKKRLKNQDRLLDANPMCLTALLQASQDLRKTQYLLEPLIVLTKGFPVRGRSPTSAGSVASPSCRLRPEQAPRGSKGRQGPELPELPKTRTFNDADCSFPQSPHRTAAWQEPHSSSQRDHYRRVTRTSDCELPARQLPWGEQTSDSPTADSSPRWSSEGEGKG